MEDAFGRHGVDVYPVKGIYGGASKVDERWTRVVEGVDSFERRMGRTPHVLVAKMVQDGHDRGANVIASAFGDMGFDRSEEHTSELVPNAPSVCSLLSEIQKILRRTYIKI